jgi:hypothetical protein
MASSPPDDGLEPRIRTPRRYLAIALVPLLLAAGLHWWSDHRPPPPAPKPYVSPPLLHDFPGECPGVIHIMPLGDSITYGIDESITRMQNATQPKGGYRPYLYKALCKIAPIQFVGSVDAGYGSRYAWRCCEGHPGLNSADIAAGVLSWDRHIPADIYLVQVGTNDAVFPITMAQSSRNNCAIWTELLSDNPRAVVLVASITPCRDGPNDPITNRWVDRYNAMLKSTVAAFAAKHPAVRFVDLHDEAHMRPADFGWVGVHPTVCGYRKIARVWADAVKPLLAHTRAAGSP